MIKRFLDIHIGKNDLETVKLRKDVDIVSFDIFDTLICRRVRKPTDVFKLIEKKRSIDGFAQNRIEAERFARKMRSSGEVTIDEIYSVYAEKYGCNKEELIKIEIEFEKKLCFPNERVVSFFEKCKESYRVILVSDMYIPSGRMAEILEKCGISGYERLYVSCDEGCTKRSGKLFRKVQNDLRIQGSKIVHIGDDILSDCIKAKKCGLQTLKIRKSFKKM